MILSKWYDKNKKTLKKSHFGDEILGFKMSISRKGLHARKLYATCLRVLETKNGNDILKDFFISMWQSGSET